jgi:hypothetical protein
MCDTSAQIGPVPNKKPPLPEREALIPDTTATFSHVHQKRSCEFTISQKIKFDVVGHLERISRHWDPLDFLNR